MSRVSELLDTLVDNKAAIKAAIIAKQPSIPPTGVMSNWAASIGSIPQASANIHNTIFRDCNGTILHQYTKDEIAAMSELPALPTSPSLTCQSWNWTLQQIKNYVATYDRCDIGAVYTTDDGKTRLTFTIQNSVYSTIPIRFQQTVANGVEVDWGDGSATQTYAGTSQQTISHAYSPVQYPATYTVTFKVNNGSMSFPTYIMGKSGTLSVSNPVTAWTNMLNEVHIGNNVTAIGYGTFSYCESLTLVTIPNSVTSIGDNAFSYCFSLASVAIPSSVTSIGSNAFSQCYSLASVAIPSSVTSIGSNAFSYCYSLALVAIPSSVTSIANTTFSYCYSLVSVSIPSSVTSIGSNAFSYCYSLVSVTIPSSVTSIGNYAFQYCPALASMAIPSSVTSINPGIFSYCSNLESVTIPSSVTSVGNYAFQYCYSLTSVTIPSSVTSIGSSTFSSVFSNCISLVSVTISSSVTSINPSTFSYCYSLVSVTIPSSVTSISGQAFERCYGLKTIDFRTATSVPTLININAFQDTPTDREIIVPDELYNDWIASSNWSSTTNNIVGSIVKASESSLGPLS